MQIFWIFKFSPIIIITEQITEQVISLSLYFSFPFRHTEHGSGGERAYKHGQMKEDKMRKFALCSTVCLAIVLEVEGSIFQMKMGLSHNVISTLN